MKIFLVLLIVAASFAGVALARYGSTTESEGTSSLTNVDNATTWDNSTNADDADADYRNVDNRAYIDNSMNRDVEYK